MSRGAFLLQGLVTILGDRFVVLAKARWPISFFVVRSKENFAYFNRISQRHVDFLVCEPARMRPLLGIELDDASHQTPARQRRDEFVERVFRTARLPLLRFPAQRAYNTQEIAARLARVWRSGVSMRSRRAARRCMPRQILRLSAPNVVSRWY